MMKKQTQIYGLFLTIILASNIFTYYSTYDYAERKFYMTQIKLDVFMLKAYDRNNTSYIDISINGGIDSIFHDAGKYNDYEKYLPLCQAFDKEFFEIIQKYYEKNRKKYGVPQDIELQNIEKNIENGKINMKKLCNVSK